MKLKNINKNNCQIEIDIINSNNIVNTINIYYVHVHINS